MKTSSLEKKKTKPQNTTTKNKPQQKGQLKNLCPGWHAIRAKF